MGVAKFTTPTFKLVFTEQTLDLTTATNVYVTFQSGNYVLTKKGKDLDVKEKEIDVYLTQLETGSFGVGPVKIQANWTYGNGRRAASTESIYQISDNLLKEVVK